MNKPQAIILFAVILSGAAYGQESHRTVVLFGDIKLSVDDVCKSLNAEVDASADDVSISPDVEFDRFAQFRIRRSDTVDHGQGKRIVGTIYDPHSFMSYIYCAEVDNGRIESVIANPTMLRDVSDVRFRNSRYMTFVASRDDSHPIRFAGLVHKNQLLIEEETPKIIQTFLGEPVDKIIAADNARRDAQVAKALKDKADRKPISPLTTEYGKAHEWAHLVRDALAGGNPIQNVTRPQDLKSVKIAAVRDLLSRGLNDLEIRSQILSGVVDGTIKPDDAWTQIEVSGIFYMISRGGGDMDVEKMASAYDIADGFGEHVARRSSLADGTVDPLAAAVIEGNLEGPFGTNGIVLLSQVSALAELSELIGESGSDKLKEWIALRKEDIAQRLAQTPLIKFIEPQ